MLYFQNMQIMCSNDDSLDWQQVMHDVQPLHSKPRVDSTHALMSKRKRVHVRLQPLAQQPAHDRTAFHAPARLEVFDHNTIKRIKTGRMVIERTLDLHGMGAEAAYDAMHEFITTSYQAECALVMVITGKGKLSSEGILRRSFAQWAEDATFRPMIIGIAEASHQHGGKGAFYVRLRRKR
jgi:DNA-nicking Smr family endonuclease